MRIAANIANIGFKEGQLDLLVSLYEFIMSNGGKSNIDDIIAIEEMVKFRESGNVELKTNKKLKDINPIKEKGTTLISYRKYQGSNRKTYIFNKPFNSLSIEEIESVLAEVTITDKVYKWWRGSIDQEPHFPPGEVLDNCKCDKPELKGDMSMICKNCGGLINSNNIR